MYKKFGFDLYSIMTTVEGNKTQVFVYDTKKLDLEQTIIQSKQNRFFSNSRLEVRGDEIERIYQKL